MSRISASPAEAFVKLIIQPGLIFRLECYSSTDSQAVRRRFAPHLRSEVQRILHRYTFDYSRSARLLKIGRIQLKEMVGAAGLEPATSCV